MYLMSPLSPDTLLVRGCASNQLISKSWDSSEPVRPKNPESEVGRIEFGSIWESLCVSQGLPKTCPPAQSENSPSSHRLAHTPGYIKIHLLIGTSSIHFVWMMIQSVDDKLHHEKKTWSSQNDLRGWCRAWASHVKEVTNSGSRQELSIFQELPKGLHLGLGPGPACASN